MSDLELLDGAVTVPASLREPPAATLSSVRDERANGAVVGGVEQKVEAPQVTSKSYIKITIKRRPLTIEIDMDKLTWGDAKELRKRQLSIQDGTMTDEQALALSDQLIEKVTGLNPDTLPFEAAQRVMEVLYAEDADAEAAEKN